MQQAGCGGAHHSARRRAGLVERGIRGLWNFTGEDLHLEGLGVPVENVHLSDSLMTLCHLVGAADEKREQNL